jgi:predicted DNA-binding mobile mystery protein A
LALLWAGFRLATLFEDHRPILIAQHEEGLTMRNEDRDSARRKLDKELWHYQMAAKKRNCTQDLLRAVRQALGVPVEEMARTLGVNKSVLFGLEQSEGRGTISLNSMERVASAMSCKFVYAIVPLASKTLEEMGNERKWSKRLGQGTGNRKFAENWEGFR